jgi:hypothetical protein
VKTEDIFSSETSVNFQWITQRYISGDRIILHWHRFESLRSHEEDFKALFLCVQLAGGGGGGKAIPVTRRGGPLGCVTSGHPQFL